MLFMMNGLSFIDEGWHGSGRKDRELNQPSIMKWPNAFGFCLIGLVMLWLPALAPGLCPPSPVFGSSTRELWLLFMGTLNTALGAGALGWHAMRQAWLIPSWLEPIQTPEPVGLPQPSRAGI
jgi:hypothetical protein